MLRCPTVLPCLLTLLLAAGCADTNNPGSWDQAKVATQMKSSLKLTEVSLSPAAGGFSGTGKAEDGETYKITVTQDPANKRLDWKAEGDRGSNEDGSYSIE
jgi:hypothetical protein